MKNQPVIIIRLLLLWVDNGSVLWIVNPSSHYVVVFSYASYLDWKLLSLNCFQLMMLKSIRCQLEETSGEFTL